MFCQGGSFKKCVRLFWRLRQADPALFRFHTWNHRLAFWPPPLISRVAGAMLQGVWLRWRANSIVCIARRVSLCAPPALVQKMIGYESGLHSRALPAAPATSPPRERVVPRPWRPSFLDQRQHLKPRRKLAQVIICAGTCVGTAKQLEFNQPLSGPEKTSPRIFLPGPFLPQISFRGTVRKKPYVNRCPEKKLYVEGGRRNQGDFGENLYVTGISSEKRRRPLHINIFENCSGKPVSLLLAPPNFRQNEGNTNGDRWNLHRSGGRGESARHTGHLEFSPGGGPL